MNKLVLDSMLLATIVQTLTATTSDHPTQPRTPSRHGERPLKQRVDTPHGASTEQSLRRRIPRPAALS